MGMVQAWSFFDRAYILTQINFKFVFDIDCAPEELVINMKSTQKQTVFKLQDGALSNMDISAETTCHMTVKVMACDTKKWRKNLLMNLPFKVSL